MAQNSNSFHINNKVTTSSVSVDNKKSRNAWHMSSDPGIYEPQRLNTFEFIIDRDALEGIPLQSGPSGTDLTTTDILRATKIYDDTASLTQEALRLSVNGASIPSISQGVLEIRRGNTAVRYAGVASFSAGQLTVQDYIGLPAMEVLYAWQALSFNMRTEKVGVAGDYKKSCYLVEYTPDYQMVRTWKLEGCWINEISEGSFSHTSGDLHNVTVTIQYDRAYIVERNLG